MDFAKAERLAALLDGKCSEQEREELLARLAADDDDLEVFSAAAAALNQHEQEERDAGVIPLRKREREGTARPRWKPPRWIGLAAAAGLAALVVAPLLWRGGRTDASTPAGIVAELASTPAEVPVDLRGTPWSPPRNVGSDRLSDARRVQLGVRLVQLELIPRDDAAGIREAAGNVATVLASDPTFGDVAERYSQIARAGLQGGELDPDLGERAIKAGGDNTVLGAWLQAARVAARTGDQKFFRSPLSETVLSGEGPGQRLLKVSTSDELRTLKEAAVAAPPRWDQVHDRLTEMLSILAAA